MGDSENSYHLRELQNGSSASSVSENLLDTVFVLFSY